MEPKGCLRFPLPTAARAAFLRFGSSAQNARAQFVHTVLQSSKEIARWYFYHLAIGFAMDQTQLILLRATD